MSVEQLSSWNGRTKKQAACVKTVEIAEVVVRVPVLVLIPFLNDSLDSK